METYYSISAWPTMYLDYVNNFLTVEKFAEHYQMTLRQAHDIVNVGRATDNFTKQYMFVVPSDVSTMSPIATIKASPIYQQVIKDSFGGVLYNVDNRAKYGDSTAGILAIWAGLSKAERESQDGIIKGAMNFLMGDE